MARNPGMATPTPVAKRQPSPPARTRLAKQPPTGTGISAPVLIVDGLVDIDAVARTFGLTKAALAQTIGFSDDTLQRFSRAHAPKTQGRLREFLEIIQRIEPWAGGPHQAIGWYRGYAIPALGDQTAEALIKHDEAALVRSYLDGYAAGCYA